MRDGMTALVGAVGGALLAIVIIFAAANTGLMPGLGDAHIRAYLLSHPELVTEMTEKAQIQQQEADTAKMAATIKKIGLKTFFDPHIAFVTGPADAKKSIVEFYDYDCPYCRASLPAMKKFYEAHKNDTRFSFIEFPIPALHGPGADLAGLASLAARRQPDKYVALHFALMGQEGSIDQATIDAVAGKVGLDVDKLKIDMQDPVLAQTLATSKDLAHKAGIDGTPTFIINGTVHPGMVEADELENLAKNS
jgi:protein-disulfide isomerase